MGRSGHNGDREQLVPAQRRKLIAERLRAEGSVTVASLEAAFGISAMTARRDLRILEDEGRAQRTHGGAVVPGMARHEDSFRRRLDAAVPEKTALAQAVVARVEDGETLFVDSSTSAYFAVQALLTAGRRITILTNAVPVMELVVQAEAPQTSLIGLSGSLRHGTRSFVGPQTIEAIRAHFADKLLFSVKGITPDGVLTDADPLEAEVKRSMVDRATASLLLLDGSKFDRTGLSAIAPVEDVDTVLVSGAGRRSLAALAGAGAHVEEVA